MEVNYSLVAAIACFVAISAWSGIFAYILNGVGEIKLQMVLAVVAMIINIPLAIVYVKYFAFGVEGVVWATCSSMMLFSIVGPIQVKRLLQRK